MFRHLTRAATLVLSLVIATNVPMAATAQQADSTQGTHLGKAPSFAHVPTTYIPKRIAPLAENRAWALEADPAGNRLVIQKLGNTAETVVPVPGFDPTTTVTGFAADNDNSLWLSTPTTLHHWDGAAWNAVSLPDYTGQPPGRIGGIAVDKAHHVYVGVTYRRQPQGTWWQQAIIIHRLDGTTWNPVVPVPWNGLTSKYDRFPELVEFSVVEGRISAITQRFYGDSTVPSMSAEKLTSWGWGWLGDVVGVLLPRHPNLRIGFVSGDGCSIVNIDTGKSANCPRPNWFGSVVALDDERIVTAGSRVDTANVTRYGYGIRANSALPDRDISGPACENGRLSRDQTSSTVWCLSNPATTPAALYRATFT